MTMTGQRLTLNVQRPTPNEGFITSDIKFRGLMVSRFRFVKSNISQSNITGDFIRKPGTQEKEWKDLVQFVVSWFPDSSPQTSNLAHQTFVSPVPGGRPPLQFSRSLAQYRRERRYSQATRLPPQKNRRRHSWKSFCQRKIS